jgi:transcriptional regulator with XRE-family HTH domain
MERMTERIRRARAAKGWSQNRLVYEIELYARQHALAVATTASLKVYVSEWENGRRAVSLPYTTILRALFGMTDAELFGQQQPADIHAVDGYEELVSHIENAHSVGCSVVDTFLEQTEAFRTLDRQMGAAQLIDSMTRHLDTLSEALTFAVLPKARVPVASALAGAATLAAWQALDVGAADRAWRHYEMAKRAAREANQPKYLAHAMGEQAYVLVDAGRTDLAVDLVGEALSVSGNIPVRLRAWLLGAQAEMYALNGDGEACRRSLDAASRVLPGDDVLRDPDMPSIFLTDAHLARWRGHSLALLGDAQAVSDLYAALDAVDSTFTRARAGLCCDLAQAHLIRGEYGDAADQLRSARRLASRTGSVRHLRRIERITGQIPS